MYPRLERVMREVCNLSQGEARAALSGISPEAVSRLGGPKEVVRWAYANRHTISKTEGSSTHKG